MEGVANFLTGFIPIAGWLGKAGQVTKAGKVESLLRDCWRAERS